MNDIAKKVPFKQLDEKTMLSGACRCSFPQLFEKRAPKGSDNEEYAITILVPKGDPMVDSFAATSKKLLLAKFNGKVPPGWYNPMRDGDLRADIYPEQAGHWTLKINNKRDQPMVLDQKKAEILDPRDLYSGCYVRVKFEMFAYDNVNKGVSCSLKLVQKIADAEPFGAVAAPETGDDLPDLDLPSQGAASADPFADFG